RLARILMAIRNNAAALVFCLGEDADRLGRAKEIVHAQSAGRSSVEIDITEPGVAELCCLFDEAYFVVPGDEEMRKKMEDCMFRRTAYFSKENKVLEV
ncbi:MAG: hypothetical protein LWX00_06950, partial [Spirochaetia bacterium]|nr:hypothetical protein [Spirochaetia bacterium]